MFEDDHPFEPMDDAGMGEPLFHGDDVGMNPVDQQVDPEEDSEDPPVINIASDDEDEIEEEDEEGVTPSLINLK
ncbi:hypothetical protein TIFTF001_032419 [Ficus carica]|uniref:Uncharacterized protein n=1 Tax=Ficus carica TaxID=3494 RepID=A0AA88DWL2_FICCA|nr:hypothetical protein TIFTF001_032419 [Ficus carica]